MVELSIVVPVYNVEAFLPACIESILRQSYNDWELILVNDGSTDNSKIICERYVKSDSRIVLMDKENGGLSSARNVGIELSQGKYITFIDSDDVIVGDDVLERIMQLFHKDTELDVVQYDVIFEYLSPNAYRRQYAHKLYTNKTDILRGYLEQQIHVSCCDKIFRLNVFNDIRFPLGQISEDIAIIPQIIDRVNKVLTSDIGFYGYRYRSGSITTSVLPYKKLVSVLRSYYSFLSYAMTYPELRSIAIATYTVTFWSYSSIVRTRYPERINDFCKNTPTIRIEFGEWCQISKCFNLKQIIRSFIICVLGIRIVLIFQRFFTRS